MTGKTERAAEARAKAQAQVKAKERRTTAVIIAVALVVITVVASVVFFIVNSAKVPTLAEMWAQENPPVPAGSDRSGGIGVGTRGTVGTDIPADVNRVDLYLDMMCPVCKNFEAANGADLDSLREAGTIQVYYHPVAILDPYSAGTKYPTRAANAVATVADQDPGHMLAFMNALFENQPAEFTPGLDDDQIAAIAVGVGVSTETAGSFTGGQFTKWVTAATQQLSIDASATTPTVMVNGVVLDQAEVPFMQPGALKSYLEALPAPEGQPKGPGGITTE